MNIQNLKLQQHKHLLRIRHLNKRLGIASQGLLLVEADARYLADAIKEEIAAYHGLTIAIEKARDEAVIARLGKGYLPNKRGVNYVDSTLQIGHH